MGAALKVTEIWRYPVKSMGGERLDETEVAAGGIPFDRGWAVRDEKTIRSAKYIPELLMCTARYLPGTNAGRVPHVEITLPDGTKVKSTDADVHARLSAALKRDVKLWSLNAWDNPDQMRIDETVLKTGSWDKEMRWMFDLKEGEPEPDFSRAPPELMENAMQYAAPPNTYFDACPISIMTASSIRLLESLVPGEDMDSRRFRANFVVNDGSTATGMAESEWIEKSIRLGGATFDVLMDIPRCKMIAAEQPGLNKNSHITRAIVRGMRQCLGVYCNVRTPGTVRLGDVLSV